MNPAFLVIVVILCVCVWFLAAFLYKPIGKMFYKIGKDAIDTMNEDDEEKGDG